MTDPQRDRIVAAFDRELGRSPVPPGLRAQAVRDALHPRDAYARKDAAGVRKRGRGTVPNRGDFDLQRHSWAPALVAVVLAVAVVATLLFVARTLRPHATPAQTPSASSSASCSASIVVGAVEPRGFLHMVTATVGWREGPARTTDGGISWQSVSPPTLADAAEGGQSSCFLDADHAWVTQATGPSPSEPNSLVVFRTADGGRTWQEGVPIPISGIVTTAWLAFIDDQHGWLFTDLGIGLTRMIYATADGGLLWSQVSLSHWVRGAVTDGCSATGMTFVNSDTGWLTWNCGSPPIIAATHDGGRSWQPVALPRPPYPSSELSDCEANPPIFSGTHGVLPVTCWGDMGGAGWGAVFSTIDAGRSWSFHQLPFNAPPAFGGQCCSEDFVNADTGWAFSAGSLSGLYRTTNGGHDWALVKTGLFSGENVDAFQFLSGGIGFVYTSSMGRQGAPWTTTDGGQTWSKPRIVGTPS